MVIRGHNLDNSQVSVNMTNGPTLVSGGIIILAVLIFVKKKAGLLPSIAPDTSDGNPGISTCIILCLCKLDPCLLGSGIQVFD